MSRNYLIEQTIEAIYKDYYGKNMGIDEYFSVFGLENSSQVLQNITVSNFRFHDFNNDISLEKINEIKEKYGVVYVVVLFQNTIVTEQGWKPVKEVTSCGPGVYCFVKSKIKEEKPVLFIYKQ